jgi:Uma2 family endonuclease
MAGMAAKKRPERYTWADYQTWRDGHRYELIGGAVTAMAPSPGYDHQAIVGALYVALARHFQGKPCRPILAPMDVRLDDGNVVQPDLLVVCDPAQLRSTHVEGAPTLVVEVLSPATWRHDRKTKLGLYAHFGVREYWLVTPVPALVEVLRLERGAYLIAGVHRPGETLASPVVPELALDVAALFAGVPLRPEDRIFEVCETDPAAEWGGQRHPPSPPTEP